MSSRTAGLILMLISLCGLLASITKNEIHNKNITFKNVIFFSYFISSRSLSRLGKNSYLAIFRKWRKIWRKWGTHMSLVLANQTAEQWISWEIFRVLYCFLSPGYNCRTGNRLHYCYRCNYFSSWKEQYSKLAHITNAGKSSILRACY